MNYVIESFVQPRNGYGWVPAHGNCKGARWFVFSTAPSVRRDRLHGRCFGSKADAESAIVDSVKD